MILRLATETDLPAIQSVIRQVVPLMLATGNAQWDDSYPDESVFQRDITRGQLWIAESDGAIAGVAAITSAVEPEYAQAGLNIHEAAIVVHRLAVDPAFRGTGVASALMRRAEEIAGSLDFNAVRVDTNVRNEATQRLFPKLGYRLAGEISLASRPNLRFFCYEKRLPNT